MKIIRLYCTVVFFVLKFILDFRESLEREEAAEDVWMREYSVLVPVGYVHWCCSGATYGAARPEKRARRGRMLSCL